MSAAECLSEAERKRHRSPATSRLRLVESGDVRLRERAAGDAKRSRRQTRSGAKLPDNTGQAGKRALAGPTDAQPPAQRRARTLWACPREREPALWPGYAPAGPVAAAVAPGTNLEERALPQRELAERGAAERSV